MQKHISLYLGLFITIGLVLWLLFAAKNGTLNLGAAADLLKIR